MNQDLLNEKFSNIRAGLKGIDQRVDDLEKTVKEEYTTKEKHEHLNRRVDKFENLWDWGIKIVLGLLLSGILALLGLGAI